MQSTVGVISSVPPASIFPILNSLQNLYLWPNLKNLSGGLNLSRSLNMVGSA